MDVYIILRSYIYTCSHNSTVLYRYIFTLLYTQKPIHDYIHIRPIYVYILQSPYTPYTYLYTSVPICVLCMFTPVYLCHFTYLHTHILKLYYIPVLHYTDTCLYSSTPIYLYMFYIYIFIYIFIYLYFIFIHTSTIINNQKMIT
jgi:hypothetical protein